MLELTDRRVCVYMCCGVCVSVCVCVCCSECVCVCVVVWRERVFSVCVCCVECVCMCVVVWREGERERESGGMPCVNTRGQNELPATFTWTRRAGGRGALTRTPSHPQVSADRPAAVTASTPLTPTPSQPRDVTHMMVACGGATNTVTGAAGNCL